MTVKLKSLKVNLNDIFFKDPDLVNDGTNGKILESALIKQGFPLNQTGTVDLPGTGIVSGCEIKTRKASTRANHTVGTMTYDDIINTPWDQTSFKEKLQTQYRVTITKDEWTGEVYATDKMVDFSDKSIQNKLANAYEQNRAALKAQGKIQVGQTITAGGQFGYLEHKPGKNGTGKSYAMRIPDSGMKKLIKEASSPYNKLFAEG
jgi:hypothetical protein